MAFKKKSLIIAKNGIFGIKQPDFREKVLFCLVVRGVYPDPPNTLSGPTTKKITFLCVSSLRSYRFCPKTRYLTNLRWLSPPSTSPPIIFKKFFANSKIVTSLNLFLSILTDFSLIFQPLEIPLDVWITVRYLQCVQSILRYKFFFIEKWFTRGLNLYKVFIYFFNFYILFINIFKEAKISMKALPS